MGNWYSSKIRTSSSSSAVVSPTKEAIDFAADQLAKDAFSTALTEFAMDRATMEYFINSLRNALVVQTDVQWPPEFLVTDERLRMAKEAADGIDDFWKRTFGDPTTGGRMTSNEDMIGKILFLHVVGASLPVQAVPEFKIKGDKTTQTDCSLIVNGNKKSDITVECKIKLVDASTRKKAAEGAGDDIGGSYEISTSNNKTLGSSKSYFIVLWKIETPPDIVFHTIHDCLKQIRTIVFIDTDELKIAHKLSKTSVRLNPPKLTEEWKTTTTKQPSGYIINSLRVVAGQTLLSETDIPLDLNYDDPAVIAGVRQKIHAWALTKKVT